MSKRNDNKLIALNYIKDQIITCALPPGSVIRIDEIAAELNFSKTPVREALLELQYENYVTVAPRKKTFVSPISLEDLKNIYEARLINEVALFKLLDISNVANSKDKLLELVERWNSMNLSDKNKDTYTMFLREDLDFHVALINLSKNPHLSHFCQELLYKSQRFWYLALYKNDLDLVRKQHIAILEALLEYDFKKVSNLVEEHILISRSMLNKL
ncbi:GntR family transcriptional regulator [Lutispora thermophila]|uniref:DNA-binding transcriptional regulator, GntR family n=1 Tax=Lutispora thermophila DSM 19022 TaxID=1122184 RepID=A0A1M6HDR3_9FIRM|nr:GntR family transcriptional regulator [Lutispora thermophila]SHJ20325.1 DNA-binding transcriptional regulator, GntR family [Lutispora thermophila DSM 19022]